MDIDVAVTYTDEARTGVATVPCQPVLSLFSIEQPWRDSAKGRSCVPEGTYHLVPYQSPSHGWTWCLHNPELGVYAFDHGKAPNGVGAYECPAELMDKAHTYCELHSANWAEQLRGCTAFGVKGQPMYDQVTGKVEPAVEDSVQAIGELYHVLGVGAWGHTITYHPAPGVVSPASRFVFNGDAAREE